MKIKTSELTGNALDFVVTRLEYPELVEEGYFESTHALVFSDGEVYTPSTNWATGGPIIEREGIMLEQWKTTKQWQASNELVTKVYNGPTPLIAAMRCYVASKLGDEVEVPEELK